MPLIIVLFHPKVPWQSWFITCCPCLNPAPQTFWNSIAYNSPPHYIFPLAKISVVLHREVYSILFLSHSVPSHSQSNQNPFLLLLWGEWDFSVSSEGTTRLSLVIPISFYWHVWEPIHSFWDLIFASFRGSTSIITVKILEIQIAIKCLSFSI